MLTSPADRVRAQSLGGGGSANRARLAITFSRKHYVEPPEVERLKAANLPVSYTPTFEYFVRLSNVSVALRYPISSVACSKCAAGSSPENLAQVVLTPEFRTDAVVGTGRWIPSNIHGQCTNQLEASVVLGQHPRERTCDNVSEQFASTRSSSSNCRWLPCLGPNQKQATCKEYRLMVSDHPGLSQIPTHSVPTRES